MFLLGILVILGLSISSRIPRTIGFRNIKRRLGNTALVIIGSLVGSALVSGSLVLSDSFDATFLNMVGRFIGENDVTISLEDKVQPEYVISFIDEDEVEDIEQMLDIEEVDGVLPGISVITSPYKVDEDGEPVINAYNIEILGLEHSDISEFGQDPKEIKKFSGNDAIISDKLALRLELKEGDEVHANYGPMEIQMEVTGIYEENGLVGSDRIIIDREFLATSLMVPNNSYNILSVSAKGGVEPDDYDGKEFEIQINDVLSDFENEKVELNITEWKQEGLDGYGIKAFILVFYVLSLFGIFSGILLIVNLYSMLAEERKREMGILRTIALTRFGLIKTFVNEGFLYSLISAVLGAFVGVGLGYALLYTLDSGFAEMGDQFSDFLEFKFAVQPESLLISTLLGFVITVTTVILSSFKISRLNIVSAIRDIKESKKPESLVKWLIKTFVVLGILLVGAFMLLSSFNIESSFEQAREQGGEENYLADLDDEEFNDMVDLVSGYLLYFGFILTAFLSGETLNRFAERFANKNIRKPVITISSILSIVFTSLLTQFDSITAALEQDEGVLLFFAMGLTLVISLSLIVTYHMSMLSRFISWLFSHFVKLRSTMQIALKYPAANKSRTGLTLVMFALVIYLIVYVGLVKATINVETRSSIENSLGGYDLVVQPGSDVTIEQLEEIDAEILKQERIEEVTSMMEVMVVMPEYKYKDLEEAEFWGDPRFIPLHAEDDSFRTYYNALPPDYLKSLQIGLGERAEGYETDEEVWNAVTAGENKVVLGDAFVQQGFGQQPVIDVGETIVVDTLFEGDPVEIEVIGKVEESGGGPAHMGLYSHVITTDEFVNSVLEEDYLEKYSSKNTLVKFEDGASSTEVTNDVKKAVIGYSISGVISLQELTSITTSMIDMVLSMFQGFLAFSLIVGTSGLAIIITRAVQERRQQIGMLRSLGFTRKMILGSFFVESTFISLLGIGIGLSMGTVGALIQFEIAFGDDPTIQPIFPVAEIALISIGIYVASIVFSILPSLRAAQLSPVEATNYPE